MIDYIKNSFKDIVKYCDKVDKVKVMGACVPYNSGFDVMDTVCTIIVELVVDLKDLKLSPEGKMNALPKLFPADLWGVALQLDLFSVKEEDKYGLKVSFNTSMSHIKQCVDKAMERAYFDVVEEVIQEAVQQDTTASRSKAKKMAVR